MKTIQYVVAVIVLALASIATAQEQPANTVPQPVNYNLEMLLSVARTEIAEVAAANVIKIIPKLPADKIEGGQTWAFYVAPSLDVKTGGKDALDSVIVKAEGFYWPNMPVGLKCNMIHIFPYSVGAESTTNLAEIAAVAEVGWTPIGPCSEDDERFGLTANRRVGLFLQGGYLFDNHDDGITPTEGGEAKKSEEEPEEPVARIKADLHYGFELGKIVFTPAATGWYDIQNNAFYYHVEADIRLVLAENYFIDTKYEKGSGAPNFNTGDQVGIGLGVAF